MSAGKPAYHAPKPSFLAKHVLFPFYDRIVTYYPYAWTPNGITLFGITCTTAASLLLFLSIPQSTAFVLPAAVSDRFHALSYFIAPFVKPGDASSSGTTPALPMSLRALNDGTVSSWFGDAWSSAAALVVAGILNLVYCVADNTDGRQARRTKRSSFIGEYLDHGLDCVTSLMSTFLLVASLGVSLPLAGVAVVVVALATVLSHIIHHEEGFLIWGNDYVTVDEAMIGFGVGLWVPALFPQVTQATIPRIVAEWVPIIPSELRYVDIIFVLFVVSQLQVMFTMISIKAAIVRRTPFVFMVVNFLWALFQIPFGEHQPTLSVLSYPAMWAITAACTCSMICHVPIVAKCAGLSQYDITIFGALIVIWLVFPANPLFGLILAVFAHIAQILLNISLVRNKKEAASAASK